MTRKRFAILRCWSIAAIGWRISFASAARSITSQSSTRRYVEGRAQFAEIALGGVV